MLARLLFFFLATPIIELLLLLQLEKVIDFWPTMGVIIVTGVAGSYLAKREGLSAWKRLQNALKKGGLPGKELMDGVIILIAGAFLLTPGVLTDLIGFAGLFPPTRYLIRRYAMRRLKRAVRNGTIQASWSIGMSSAPPSPPEAEPSSSEASERDGDGQPGWEGESRRVPRHAADEIGEAGTGGEER